MVMYNYFDMITNIINERVIAMSEKMDMSDLFKNVEVIKSENAFKPLDDEEKSVKTNEFENRHWLRLDNAATIYPAAKNRVWDASFRLGVVLKEDVDGELLQKAMDDIFKKIPNYKVQLRMGLFWYYFEQMQRTDVVEEESYYPCSKFDVIHSDKPPIRVIYYKRRIAIEVFHSVADGGSANEVLKMLVSRYLQLKGYDIKKSELIVDYEAPPTESEQADHFQKHYRKMKGLSRAESNAYQYRPKSAKHNFAKVIHAIMPVEDVKRLSKEKGVSITEYLTAVMLYAFYINIDKPINKHIKISVPMNLRPRLISDTFRNFSLFTNIGFNPKKRISVTFDEILDELRGQLKEGLSEESIYKMISSNVGDSRNPILKYMPMVVKFLALKVAYRVFGQYKFTAPFTNLGVAKWPDDINEHIDRLELVLGGSPTTKLNFAAVSDGEYINLACLNYSEESVIEKNIFRFLAEQGVRIRIESSVDDCESEVGTNAL